MALTNVQKWYAYQRILTAQRSGGASESFSAEAALAFEAYADLGAPLNDTQKAYLSTYIDTEVTAGNHQKKDYEVLLWLGDTNSLIDYIGGKTATAVNAPVFGATGCTFNGTEYITSGWNPTSDGVNYTQNNAQISSFVKSLASGTAVRTIAGGGDATIPTRILNYSGRISTVVNGSGEEYATGYNAPLTDYLLAGVRPDSTEVLLYYNGVNIPEDIPTGEVSSGVPNIEFRIGSYNNNGVNNTPFVGTLSNILFGGALPDQAAHYTNLTTMLTTAGVI